MEHPYDRTAEDTGNSVALEHVNTTVPDQQLATLFYVTGLGLTRDPYIMTGLENMWMNVGRSQFHLPTKEPQVLRGHTGLVLPDRAAGTQRAESRRCHQAAHPSAPPAPQGAPLWLALSLAGRAIHFPPYSTASWRCATGGSSR